MKSMLTFGDVEVKIGIKIIDKLKVKIAGHVQVVDS